MRGQMPRTVAMPNPVTVSPTVCWNYSTMQFRGAAPLPFSIAVMFGKVISV